MQRFAEYLEQFLRYGWVQFGGKAVLILGLGWALFILLNLTLKRFEASISEKEAIREHEAVLRLKTFSSLVRWLGSISISVLVIYMLLDHLGINVAPVLAGAGIAGLAVGFGGQYLIRDIINGIFILIEGQYRINDVVKIGDHGGLVEELNLRLTKLRDLEGRTIYIPNGEVKTVINFTQDYAHALLNVGVGYKENIDRVMAVIKEIGAGLRKDPHYGRLILEDLEMLGVDALTESQVTLAFRIKTVPIKQWDVAREFRRRLKNRFDELGIEVPYPHRVLFWGNSQGVVPGTLEGGKDVSGRKKEV